MSKRWRCRDSPAPRVRWSLRVQQKSASNPDFDPIDQRRLRHLRQTQVRRND